MLNSEDIQHNIQLIHLVFSFSNYGDVIGYFKTNQQLLTGTILDIVDFGRLFSYHAAHVGDDTKRQCCCKVHRK